MLPLKPGTLVVVTGLPEDSSSPDTTCWTDELQILSGLHCVTKGTTAVVIEQTEPPSSHLGFTIPVLHILLDTGASVWTWLDAVTPA